ncbi:TPA: hypothetical protein HA244_01155 [Candidatus Micrarchaeota archaeon]|nr:hypothetical protein [Candidatus Micrarchaeota archaeon]
MPRQKKYAIVNFPHENYPGGLSAKVFGKARDGRINYELLGPTYRFGPISHQNQIPNIPEGHALELERRRGNGWYAIYKSEEIPKDKMEAIEQSLAQHLDRFPNILAGLRKRIRSVSEIETRQY